MQLHLETIVRVCRHSVRKLSFITITPDEGSGLGSTSVTFAPGLSRITEVKIDPFGIDMQGSNFLMEALALAESWIHNPTLADKVIADLEKVSNSLS